MNEMTIQQRLKILKIFMIRMEFNKFKLKERLKVQTKIDNEWLKNSWNFDEYMEFMREHYSGLIGGKSIEEIEEMWIDLWFTQLGASNPSSVFNRERLS